MNRTTFFATLVGVIGLTLGVNAKDKKDCSCRPGECKKANCKDCKDCDCKKGQTDKRPNAGLTPLQLKRLKDARERHFKEVERIVGKDKMAAWKKMQDTRHKQRSCEKCEKGPSGRPGGPRAVPTKPTRPQLRKPTK